MFALPLMMSAVFMLNIASNSHSFATFLSACPTLSQENSHASAVKAENDGLKTALAAYEPTPAVLMNMDTATLNSNMSRIKQSMDMYTAELGARAAAAKGPSCAICYSSGITSIGGLPCGHTYCWSCCDRLVKDGAGCPHCREPINKPPMRLFGLVPDAGVQAAQSAGVQGAVEVDMD